MLYLDSLSYSSENPGEVCEQLLARIKGEEIKQRQGVSGLALIGGGALKCSPLLHHFIAPVACTRHWNLKVRVWALESVSGFVSRYHLCLCDLM